MASTFNPTVGARTTLAITGLSTLASGTYVRNTTAYPCNTNKPFDVILEVDLTTSNVASGNKQAVVFIQESLDGTNFRSGPSSGTTVTDEPNLRVMGTVPMNSTNAEIATFSVRAALGYIPYSCYFVIKNDLGVALTAGTLWTSEISAIST